MRIDFLFHFPSLGSDDEAAVLEEIKEYKEEEGHRVHKTFCLSNRSNIGRVWGWEDRLMEGSFGQLEADRWNGSRSFFFFSLFFFFGSNVDIE